jgi:outer membrane protein assembly factor BamB
LAALLLLVGCEVAIGAAPAPASFVALNGKARRVYSGTPSLPAHMFAPVVLPVSSVRAPLVTYRLVSGPAHGVVTFPLGNATRRENEQWPSSTANLLVLYTSERNYVGEDSFTWQATDGSNTSNVATCLVTVVEAGLEARDQTVCVESGSTVEFPALFYGGGTGYTYSITLDAPAHGEASVTGTTVRYRPDASYVGADAFQWRLVVAGGKPIRTPPPSATCRIVVKRGGMNDWPQWYADESRTGFTTMRLPDKLQLQWKRNVPQIRSVYPTEPYRDLDFSRPVQMGKRLFVPCPANDSLMALNTETGEQLWRRYAGGAVRRPAAAARLPDGNEVVVFGSDDGWVHCLQAQDGAIRWKFHAAPNGRMAMGFGRLSSVWPILASPVICEDKVYVVAGMVPSFGLFGYGLDLASGKIVWENPGRIADVYNTSAFGPLAVSFDRQTLLGSVEGAASPWMVDRATGAFLGHQDAGFKFPGGGRAARFPTYCGWYADGSGTYNIPDPVRITVGQRTIDRTFVEALGVKEMPCSLAAGDGRLFIMTEAGWLYCFGASERQPVIHPAPPPPPPVAEDEWTRSAGAMLHRKDLRQGLAMVWGLAAGKDAGRLALELAKQSTLMVVAIEPDADRVQTLHARLEAEGLPASRLSVMEAAPDQFEFAPYQVALLTSENPDSFWRVLTAKPAERSCWLERMGRLLRPFGGECWMASTEAQHADLRAGLDTIASLKPFEVERTAGGYTRIARLGLMDEPDWLKPPFGLSAFGSGLMTFGIKPPARTGHVMGGRDEFSCLPVDAPGPGTAAPLQAREKGYPTNALISALEPGRAGWKNPLLGQEEGFPGLPFSGVDTSCGAISHVGSYGFSAGKMASFFDASDQYWGRLFFPEIGGCGASGYHRDRSVVLSPSTVSGGICGCISALMYTQVAITPMPGEENWVCYTRVRTSRRIEDTPIRKIGINFGAPGDRYASDTGVLWTHHPYAGRYGRMSYTQDAMPEALPLVPIVYRGEPVRVYSHSAVMDRSSPAAMNWVSASRVEGMTEITIPLVQRAIALRATVPPNPDGKLDDACWDGQGELSFVPHRVGLDPLHSLDAPRPDETCFALFRHDDRYLYLGAGVRARYGKLGYYNQPVMREATWMIASRDEAVNPLTFQWIERKGCVSTNCAATEWKANGVANGADRFTVEMAVPWAVIEGAGIKRDQVVMNVDINRSRLAGGYDRFRTDKHEPREQWFVAMNSYVPLWLDRLPPEAAQTAPHAVRLFFAEMDDVHPGDRVFDVSLQGQPVLRSLDVRKEAGVRRKELVKEFKDVPVSDRLTIGFSAQHGKPMLSGVEIVRR